METFIRLCPLGAKFRIQPEGRKKLSSYSNYFIGNDPRKWRTRVPQFAEVWYRRIYPGTDLVYYSNEGQLEYDFIVAPSANPNRIEFSVQQSEPVSPIRLNQQGDLVIPGRDGEVIFHKPLLYQGKSCSREEPNHGADTSGCKALSGGAFRLRHTAHGGVLVRFGLPVYDHTQPLIIDPAVVFSTYLGGSAGDGVDSLTVDSAGNTYLYGDTSSSDFPVTAGAYQKTLASPPNVGGTDAFITKLSPDGSQVLWSTYLGGSKDEYPRGMAVDSAGNVWVTGQTWSSDFPVVNPFQAQSHSYSTGYVSELSADGSKLLYSTFLGGSSQDTPLALALDAQNEPIVVGQTASRDFPVLNAFQPAHAADNQVYDAFVTKLSSDGASLIFSTYLGGDSNDYAEGVALDSSGNIYVAGITGSTDFPTTTGAFQPAYVSDPAGSSFISKLSPSGTTLIYSTYLVDCWIFGIAVNNAGNAFVTGHAGSFAFPVTPGAFQTVQGGGSAFDAFITEFDSTGSSLVYSTFLGGNNNDYGSAIAVDSSNNAFVTGQTDSSNFPLQSPLQTTFYQGVPSVFVSEVNGTGSALVFSTYWGGGVDGYGSQQGNAIAVDSLGNIVVGGSSLVPDFPVVNPIQAHLSGPGDAIIAKFEFAPDFTVSGSPQSITVPAGQPANYSVTLTPLNGFNQKISLTCSGAPPDATCSVSPSTLTLDGTNAASVTVAVATVARSGVVIGNTRGGQFTNPVQGPEGVVLSLALFAVAMAVVTSPLSGRRMPAVIATLVFAVAVWSSCGGGSSGSAGVGGTPVGNYTITVTASGGSLNRSMKLGLVIQ